MAEDILHFQSAICIDKINRGMKGAMIRASDLSRRLLEEGYNVRISTVGVSMFPLINTGDKISVMPASDLAIGDLIVCMDDKKMVCHRLARIFTRDGIRFYQTRGDAFLRFDAPVTLDRILGKVTMIERKHVSWPRRLLLLMYPVLMHSRLNAFVFLILSKLKAVFSPRQELLN